MAISTGSYLDKMIIIKKDDLIIPIKMIPSQKIHPYHLKPLQ